MKVVIDIPEKDIPQKQDFLTVDLHFIDGVVCECTYPFEIQQPCEDCISRKAVLNTLDFCDNVLNVDRTVESYKSLLAECYKELPPIQPKAKVGHWIKSRDSYDNNHFTCPFCEHDIATKADFWEDNYCPNCGAKMESEDKE